MLKKFSYQTRQKHIAKLKSNPPDILIIGGGITGAGIARDAAMRGLKVALVEKSDFAAGTSSRSSKMIHGGLRYLTNFKMGLVYESCTEKALLQKIIPHLCQPLPYLYPVYSSDKYPLWMVNTGLWFYDLFSMFRNHSIHKKFTSRQVISLEPDLRQENLDGAVLYYDLLTNDARLTLENIKSANRHGAMVINYLEAVNMQKRGGQISAVELQDNLSGEQFQVECRIVVGAAGPWTDKLLRVADHSRQRLRITKGVHLVVPREKVNNHYTVVMKSPDDQRFTFVVPWDKFAYIGTTDTDYTGDLNNIYATPHDVEYLLKIFSYYFPDLSLGKDDIISTWAGARPLINGEDSSVSISNISREHQIFSAADNFILIAGGKLTTFRKMAAQIVNQTISKLHKYGYNPRTSPCRTAIIPIQDRGFNRINKKLRCSSLSSLFQMEKEVVEHLINQYGDEVIEVLELCKKSSRLKTRIVPELPYIWAEAKYSAAYELCLTLEDFMTRRTQLFLQDRHQGLVVAKEVADFLAQENNWRQEQKERYLTEYQQLVHDSRRFK